MTDLERLIAARDLLALPGGWTQGCAARDKFGFVCGSLTKEAVCFCPFGAWWRAGSDSDDNRIGDLLDLPCAVVSWNDRIERTQAEVVARFDAAIERERARVAA